jgi:hypothetical protein
LSARSSKEKLTRYRTLLIPDDVSLIRVLKHAPILQCHLCELWDILYPFDGRGGR